ncbi:hypothetical protein [Umezawaea sp. NPDC059074]|uniref:hypothetical protein n=1 Tax=Umezawaea sp. NPDC059074 TaxID=3346716 RepID=UPI00369EF4BC
MRDQRREFVRLCRCVVTGPRWQVVVAVVVSAWTFAWIVGQVGATPLSPLAVVRGPIGWAGIPIGWLDAVGEWIRDRQDVLAGLAVVAGLLWAVTTERGRLAASTGWFAVLVAAEAIGYAAAVHRALLTFGVVVAVFAVLSFLGRRAFVVDRVALLPRGVLHASATAVTLSAVVPLIAPGLLIAGLVRPYVTVPPRFDPTRSRIPRQRVDSEVRVDAERSA